MVGILRRNIEDKYFIDYTAKFVKVALTYIFDSFRQGGSLRYNDNLQQGLLYKSTEQLSTKEIDVELQSKHKRSLIINIIRDIIHLHQREINDHLEDPLLFTNYQIKKITGENYKGIIILLNMLMIGIDS